MSNYSPSVEAKGYIRNINLYEEAQTDYMDTLEFAFRPTLINQQLAATYEKMRVIGMSHQYSSFSHTENAIFTFELYLNSLMIIKELSFEAKRGASEGSKNDLKLVSKQIEEQRRFLESLTLPYESPNGMISSQPTPVILCIPKIVTIRARLLSVSIVFEECDINGNIKALRAQVTFEEAPLRRITMRDHLSSGMFRTWGG